MASLLTKLGRVVLFGLIITQSLLLSAYLAKYEGNSKWYFMAFSFGPAIGVWFVYLCSNSPYLGSLFGVWGLYIVALVVNIAVILAIVGDRISKTEVLSPNVLKAILCITPLLLVLFLFTGMKTMIVSELRFSMTVDLLDGVVMIDTVLKGIEHDLGIPKAFSITMIVFACISFTMSIIPWKMLEDRSTERGQQIILCRNILHTFFVNVPFLVIRAVVFYKFGKDESIFIAKNLIGIMFSSKEFLDL
ncbi:unnamed protein product, partial [Pocillopora meandrina]